MTPPPTLPTDTDWRLVIDAAQFFLYIVLGIYMWAVGKSKATNSRIAQLEDTTLSRVNLLEKDIDKRMDGYADRQARTEERVSHLPTRESVGKIHARLDDLQKAQAIAQGELKGIHKTLDLIHKHMLEKDK